MPTATSVGASRVLSIVPPLRPLPLLPGIRSHTVTLSFQRDRNIRERPQIQELQREVDTSLASVARMERSKKSFAGRIATALGVVGAAFLAASVMMGAVSVEAIVIGAIGLVAWAAAAIAYFGIKASRTVKLDALIDREQNRIFEAGDEATSLIYQSHSPQRLSL